MTPTRHHKDPVIEPERNNIYKSHDEKNRGGLR